MSTQKHDTLETEKWPWPEAPRQVLCANMYRLCCVLARIVVYLVREGFEKCGPILSIKGISAKAMLHATRYNWAAPNHLLHPNSQKTPKKRSPAAVTQKPTKKPSQSSNAPIPHRPQTWKFPSPSRSPRDTPQVGGRQWNVRILHCTNFTLRRGVRSKGIMRG